MAKEELERVPYVEHLKSDRPEREKIIQDDEIKNMMIALETDDWDTFLKRM